jgi:lactate dehydrogenase-like 2-hydroxyacid dehydrogenase
LQDGEVAGAGIDVFEQKTTLAANPPLGPHNAIVTLYLAGTSGRWCIAA